MKVLEQLLFWVHGLSGAAWFGAIFYRTLVVDAKAFAFFASVKDYEHFSTHLAHNMRYFVTAGLLTCGLSGFALVGLRWDGSNAVWLALIAAKAAVWLGACELFTYVSWVHWPWRACAAPDEFATYRKHGQQLAIAMVVLAGAGFTLGQACRVVPWLSARHQTFVPSRDLHHVGVDDRVQMHRRRVATVLVRTGAVVGPNLSQGVVVADVIRSTGVFVDRWLSQ